VTTLPPRVRPSRKKGWRLQEAHPGGRVVTRPGRYGNPFTVADALADDPTLTKDQARERCARYHARWLDGDPEFAHIESERRAWVLDHVRELASRPLACWCPLPEPGQADHCHAAHLIELANKPAIRETP